MKFIIARDTFAESITWIARSLPIRPTIPILSGILLEAKDQELTISIFDYEVSATETVQVQVFEEGSVLLSGKLLAEICRTLPNADIEISTQESHVLLSCASTEFILPIMSTSDYPALPQLPPSIGSLSVEKFTQAVNQVIHSASKDDTLPMLTGIKCEIREDHIVLAATDRFRLAVKKIEWNPQSERKEYDLLIPAKRIAEIVKSIPSGSSDIDICLPQTDDERILGYSVKLRKSTSRLLDQQYPPYAKLLPAEHAMFANISVSQLTEAIKRVSLVAFRGSIIKLEFSDNSVIITGGGDEAGRAKEDIPAEIFGESLSIAFNPQYILDGLHAMQSSMVSIALNNANKAAVLREGPISPEPLEDNSPLFKAPDADFVYLVMPTRLPG